MSIYLDCKRHFLNVSWSLSELLDVVDLPLLSCYRTLLERIGFRDLLRNNYSN